MRIIEVEQIIIIKLWNGFKLNTEIDYMEEITMEDKISMFELAAKEKYRFPFNGENLTLEQLYDLSINDLIKVLTVIRIMTRSVMNEKCFIDKNKIIETLDIQTCIIKHIIASKIDDNNYERDMFSEIWICI